MKPNARRFRLNSSRKIRERTRPSRPLSEKRKEGLCVARVLSVVVVVYVGDHRRGTIRARARGRDPERESKRERILCSIFFDRKEALAEKRETRRSFVVQDWKKRGKLRENLNLNTSSSSNGSSHHHRFRLQQQKREREESTFERVVF